MKQFNHVKGFSLIEVLVSLAVLGLIFAGAAATFSSVQQAWRKQRNTIDLVQNARWALERMANEIRQGGAPVTISGGGGERIRFRPSPGPPAPFVWYWRGNTPSDGTGFGDRNFIYRGEGTGLGGLGGAYNVRQQLANFIVANPSGNNIFTNAGGGLYTIELTVNPKSGPPPPTSGNYTLRTQVRVRN